MASYAVAPIGKATPEQQRLALLTAEDRFTDRKTGELTLEGNRYWAPELADHSAKRVTVRFDPDNLHGEVHVYERSGAFICTAPAIEKTGFFDKASAGKRRAQEADLRRQVRDVEKATGLIEAAKLAAMMPEHPDEADAPSPSVVRPVRHRGQTAAALKPVSEAVQAPLNPVLDRLSHLRLVG
ncbi:Mu transposase C-terminal domain-containing protein [Sphingomonas paucimobilis]|nr:Mu transposase C-terminal domain-containing protein [Sphingomonas paucimobilis]QRY97284.1 Mu transposase C-terminal domain-containing protein [Sphingomonas paucimobilis]